jgi:hypothetical protein
MTTRFANTLRAMTVAIPFALGAISIGSAPAPATTGCNDLSRQQMQNSALDRNYYGVC